MLATAFARAMQARRAPIVTSRVSRSPGTTGSRNFALSTPRSHVPDTVEPSGPCISRIVATWASVSIMSTPGISGDPGKCPWKKSSLTVTFLTALMRRPGSCSMTASTSGEG